MALELWIPDTARRELGLDAPPRRVRLCTVCGTRFPLEQTQQWGRHVTACARRNEDAIEAELDAHNNNGFTGILDKEKFEWVRRRRAEGKKLEVFN
jgi:hypothetical protein